MIKIRRTKPSGGDGREKAVAFVPVRSVHSLSRIS